MGFARDEGRAVQPTMARIYQGDCHICDKPILAGQQYIGGIGGGLTARVRKVHWDCYGGPARVRLVRRPAARRGER